MATNNIEIAVRVIDDELMTLIANKVRTWDALCKCTDEFGPYDTSFCTELLDADNDAMIALKAGLLELLHRYENVPHPN